MEAWCAAQIHFGTECLIPQSLRVGLQMPSSPIPLWLLPSAREACLTQDWASLITLLSFSVSFQRDFSDSLVGKESASNAEDPSSIPG